MNLKKKLKYLFKNIVVVIGIVLIWRGIWYALDTLDRAIFGDTHFWTAIFGVLLGFVMLYLPDRNLKEIERL